MKKKFSKKAWLRAAVSLAFLGGAAIPMIGEALTPTRLNSGDHYYSGSFDWSKASNFDTRIDANRQGLSYASDVSLHFTDDNFYAYNVSAGRKKLTQFYHANQYGHTISGENAWASLSREVKDKELTQNGVDLYNLRQHTVSYEPVATSEYGANRVQYFNVDVYYTVGDTTRSHLSFKDEGITWEAGKTLVSTGDGFDFGTNGLTVDLDTLKIKNPGDITSWTKMNLIQDGNYSYTAFYDKMKNAVSKSKKYEYNTNTSASIAVSGVIDMATGIGQSQGKNVLTLAARDNRLQTLDVDLTKIGGTGGDAWNTENPLYTGPKRNFSYLSTKQDFSVNPLTVTIKEGSLAGGTTDASIKAGDTMTLVTLDGLNTNQITTKYGTETITGEKTLDAVNFSDASAGGVAVTGTHTDTLTAENESYTYSSGTTSYYRYNLKYTIGNKNITGVTSSASGIDLSNTTGGFVADSGYTIDSDITLDLENTKFINTAKAGNYTLLDLSKANGSGTLSIKGKTGDAGTSATLTSDEYTVNEATNGVTAIGTKDITFTVTDGKKIDVSASVNPNVSKIKLGAYDVTKTPQTIGNLVTSGTIDASELSITGMTLQDAANFIGTLTIANAETDGNTFSAWTGYTEGEQGYTVYNNGNGTITATLAGTLNTTDGNINLATNGLKSIAYNEIDWSTSATPAVTLTGGKLGGVDVSHMYTWEMLLKSNTETMHLLDAKNLSSGNIDITAPTSCVHYTNTAGNTTVNTYHSPITKGTESVSAAGMTLSLKCADQITATETKNDDNTYNFSVDVTTNKKIATGFSIPNKITWTNGGEGLVLKEDIDFSALTDNAITFDATDPYNLISNPDDVALGDTMTFFNANGHMTDTDWANKVAVRSGSTTNYEATERAVTIQGSVALDVEKDDTNKKVTGTVSDEYLTGVAIDLSKIGNTQTDTQDQWVNGGTLYSQTASKQDYGADGKKTSISVSGTTDESVKAGESMTLVHIEGTNAGVLGNITEFNETKTVGFSDTAENGITATGAHTDTLQSTVSGASGQGTYDLTYTVGKKTITGITATNLDLTKGAFTAGHQYTIGSDSLTIDVNDLVIGETGNVTSPIEIINFTDDTDGGSFQLKTGSGAAGNTATSAISYAETDAEAVNGVKAAGNQNRNFSVTGNGKIVTLDSITKDTSKVTISAVDLSKEIRSFDNLAETGTIDADQASYSYSEWKEIADVAGKKIAVATATGTNKFNNGKWTGLPTGTQQISVTQETGITANVNATYDTEDGNINLHTSGLESITFGQNIAWDTSDTAAVTLSGQNVNTVDFSAISFADSDIKRKPETMHLLNAQGMSNAVNASAPTAGWTSVDGESGTVKYNKNDRIHVDEDNLSGSGITLTVDRGDQIVTTTTTGDGKTNYTLDYTRGKGFVTGMTIADTGITWENGTTAITLDEDYDFTDAGTLTFPANKISNVSTLKSGDSMTLFDANGHMTDTDWTNIIQINPASQTISEYTDQATRAVAISGTIDIELAKETTKKVTATVSDQNMNTIAIDLSKIGKSGDATDTWSAGTTLYTNDSSTQDYGAKNVTVSIDTSTGIFSGTTDESVKSGDTMKLLDITGKNAGMAGNLTAIDTTSTVNFKDKETNGLTITGTHTDTIKSTATGETDSTTGNYALVYTVGKKELTANSSISAAELDVTQGAFKAGTQYTLTGDVTIDVRNIEFKNTGDGTKTAIIDFTGDSGSGKFKLTSDGKESGATATNSVSYREDAETNGILAAGNQNRTFSSDGKTVYLDSVTQDVNEVTVGQVDFSQEIRSFDNLTETGKVLITEEGSEAVTQKVILDNLALTTDEGKNFTIAKATGTYNFNNWELPDGEQEIYARQETGVVGIMKGEFNTEDDNGNKNGGDLRVKMKGIEGIEFSEGVKWRNGIVLDFAGTDVDFTGKTIDASKLSFDKDSVESLVKTDGAYQMVLINTDEANHLKDANITNNDNIEMTIADTVKFQGKTTLSADKKQFIADMIRGTETISDSTHHHVMAQDAAMQAVVNGNVDTVNSITGALTHFCADDVEANSMVFAGIGGNSTTTKTGSHISEHLWNVNAGVATKKDFANGAHSEYALYYEGGNGNYSTHYDGETLKHTSGKLKHHGGGFLFRYESKDAVYGEAGFHVGRIKNENDRLGMDDSQTYYGFHLGVGKIIRTNAKDSFDIYTKFYFNHTGGMDYRNSSQTEVNLDAVTSKLLRIGGRYNHQVENNWAFYTGAAFAYEFGGNADGTAGMIGGSLDSIRTATTRGAGAILELGFRKDATNDVPWEIDFGITGYMGRQKGIGGNIGLKYHF